MICIFKKGREVIEKTLISGAESMEIDEIFNDFTTSLQVKTIMPKEITLSKEVRNFLSTNGIVGMALIEFDSEIGPILKNYYMSEKSTFINKLIKNPALAVEISIIGKYAQEIVTKDKEKILIMGYISKDKFNRSATNYVIFELSGNKKRLARKLLEKVVRDINGKKDPKRVFKSLLS